MTTKRIQNTALAGKKLTLRHTRDARGRAVMVQGDDEGVFEMPDADADFLLGTPGWKSAERKARALPPAPPAQPETLRTAVQTGPKKPPLAPPAPTGAVTAPKPPPGPPEGSEGSSSSGEGGGEDSEPDVEALIDGLRTKIEAQQFADAWRAKGYEIPELNDDMLLRDMKEKLAEALLVDDEEEPASEDETPKGEEG